MSEHSFTFLDRGGTFLLLTRKGCFMHIGSETPVSATNRTSPPSFEATGIYRRPGLSATTAETAFTRRPNIRSPHQEKP